MQFNDIVLSILELLKASSPPPLQTQFTASQNMLHCVGVGKRHTPVANVPLAARAGAVRAFYSS